MSELTKRNGSQILRTFLPQQTADVKGGIYRVVEWSSASKRIVDQDILRRRLLREIRPWEMNGNDAGIGADLRAGANIEVVELDDERGVLVEPFPQVWLCRTCKRIGRINTRPCRCGARSWGQLHFLGFHTCGAVVEPWIPRCPTHDDVRLVSPKSTKAADIAFTCPECHVQLMRGLGFNRTCPGCNQGVITWNVHKARSVYAPHSMVVVNPPRPERMRELLAAGGPRKALAWVLSGMTASSPLTMSSRQTVGSFVDNLVHSSNIDPDFARTMAQAALAAGQIDPDPTGDEVDTLPESVRRDAEEAAVDIALAVGETRTQTTDLPATVTDPQLTSLYTDTYPTAVARAGLVGVDLVDDFPVLNIMYGYTRGGGSAGDGRLVPFRAPRGGYRLHSDFGETEAIYVRLDPARVANWLVRRRHTLTGWNDGDTNADAARIAILRAARYPEPGDAPVSPATVGQDVFTLVHTYAHRLVRQTAVFAGIDRDALSEYLIPTHLGFFVYAASRGDFVLGGLQAMFESDLAALMSVMRDAEHRCPLDPGCSRGAGACSACLHIGETSCRSYNMFLNRPVLFGPDGYLTTTPR